MLQKRLEATLVISIEEESDYNSTINDLIETFNLLKPVDRRIELFF